jgi:hypothetical protein
VVEVSEIAKARKRIIGLGFKEKIKSTPRQRTQEDEKG